MTLMTDAVEKGFSVPERRRIFHERLPIENINSGILHFELYYCPLWMVHRSLIDFFNSIDPSRRCGLHRGRRPKAFNERNRDGEARAVPQAGAMLGSNGCTTSRRWHDCCGVGI